MSQREEEKVVTVKFGDSSERVGMMMPATLQRFVERVRRAFPEVKENIELWLDSGAMGRVPGQGRDLLRNEAEYRSLMDGDVVVFVAGGKKLKRSPAFDGEFETTYRRDYVAKEFPEPLGDYEQPEWLSVHMPHDYGTTQGRDYQKRPSFPETNFDYDVPPRSTLPFEGRTTYQTDYIPKALPLCDTTDPRPWTYTGSLPIFPKSSYSYDYSPQKTVPPKGIPKSHPKFRHPGAPTPSTNYQSSYRGKPGEPFGRELSGYDWNGPAPPLSTTTYRRDYTPHDLTNQVVYVEPLDFQATSTSS